MSFFLCEGKAGDKTDIRVVMISVEFELYSDSNIGRSSSTK